MSVYKKERVVGTEVIYKLFLTVWDAFLFNCSLLFFHLKTNKNKTKRNQQHDVKITKIDETGSHVSIIKLLGYCNTHRPLVFYVGSKDK